jgi:hypothetical protein
MESGFVALPAQSRANFATHKAAIEALLKNDDIEAVALLLQSIVTSSKEEVEMKNMMLALISSFSASP